jgi:site-specific DNA recombinase
MYHGSHEPLVTREVWEQVQGVLDGRKSNRRRKSAHEFPYSGMVTCGHCGCSLVAELKKGRYVYYHCTGYRGKCGEPYTREEALEQRMAESLRELVIPSAVLAWLNGEVLESDQTERAARAQVVRRDQAELERLQRRLELLYEDRLEGRIDAGTYDRKAQEIVRGQQLIQQQIQGAQTSVLASVGESVNFLAGISEAAGAFHRLENGKRRDLLRLVVENAVWKGGELRMSFKKPFAELRLSNSATTGNCSSLRGNDPIFDNWRRGGDSNSRYP